MSNDEMQKMKFDELLVKIGQFGPYQGYVFVLVGLVASSTALIVLAPVFVLDIPQYRCAIQGYSNDTYSIQNDHHQELVNLTVPLVVSSQGETTYSKCQLYNVTEVTSSENRTMYECAKWVYDTSVIQSSGITDFNMVCQDEILRSHSNMLGFAGGFPGCLIFGPIADVFGRKKALLLSILTTVVTSVAVAISPNYGAFVSTVFFNNFASMGLFMIAFVMAMEITGPGKRAIVTIAIEFFWVLWLFVLDLAAYYFRQWRHLRLVIGVPPVIFLLYWWILPESPIWLISKGKKEEASKTLRKIAESNKMQLEEEVMKNVTVEEEEKTVPIWKMFTSRVLLLRTFIILFNWLTANLIYYGLSLNVGNLSGNIYLNFFVFSLMELLAYVGCFFLLTRLGRKTMLCASYLVGGVACLATIVPVIYGPSSSSWMVITFAMIGKLGASASYAVVYILTAELLPTVVRQSGLAICSMSEMTGGMISPYIADLGILVKGPMSDALPLIVFGSLAILSGLLAFQLPETKDRLLPETIEDAINFGRPETRRVKSIALREMSQEQELEVIFNTPK